MFANDKLLQARTKENAAYPSGICAERTAMFLCQFSSSTFVPLSAGYCCLSQWNFKETDFSMRFLWQVLLETKIRFNKDIEIILYGKKRNFNHQSIETFFHSLFVAKSLINITRKCLCEKKKFHCQIYFDEATLLKFKYGNICLPTGVKFLVC